MKKIRNLKIGFAVDLAKFIVIELILLTSIFPAFRNSPQLYWGILTVACVLSLCIAWKQRGNLSPGIYTWILFLGGWMGVTSFFSSETAEIVQLKSMAVIFCLICLILFNLKRESDIAICLNSVLLLSIVLTVYLIALEGGKQILAERLGTNAGINSNELSGIFAYSIIICLYKFTLTKRKGFLVYAGFLFILILLTGSKSGLLLCVFGGFIYLFLSLNNKGRLILSVSCILLSAIIIVVIMRVPILYHLIGKRFLDMLEVLVKDDSAASYSTTVRLELLHYGFLFFKRSIIWGTGIGSFRNLFYGMTGIDYYSHNNFIEILVSFGVIGGALFYGMFFFLLYKLSKQKKRKKSVVFAYVVVLMALTAGLFGVNYDILLTYILIGISYKIWVFNLN